MLYLRGKALSVGRKTGAVTMEVEIRENKGAAEVTNEGVRRPGKTCGTPKTPSSSGRRTPVPRKKKPGEK